MAKKKELAFAISEIKEISSFYNSIESLGIKELDHDNIAFSRRFRFSFDEDEGAFKIKTDIEFKQKLDKKKQISLFGIITEVKFLFKDWEDIVKLESDVIDMPDNLSINLISIAFSTTRGFLAAKTANTDYSNFVLPLIDPKQFNNLFLLGDKKEK